jgi:hypothetical protein
MKSHPTITLKGGEAVNLSDAVAAGLPVSTPSTLRVRTVEALFKIPARLRTFESSPGRALLGKYFDPAAELSAMMGEPLVDDQGAVRFLRMTKPEPETAPL